MGKIWPGKAGFLCISGELDATAISTSKTVLTLDNGGGLDEIPDRCSLSKLSLMLDSVSEADPTLYGVITLDSDGDLPLTSRFEVGDLLNGATTATSGGGGVDLASFPWSHRSAIGSTSGTLYLVLWLDAGTANAKALLFWETE